MSNITLAIEDDILIKVRKLAVERRTTLTAMVRNTLRELAAREDVHCEEVIEQLRDAFNTSSVQVGDKTWTREDLHAR